MYAIRSELNGRHIYAISYSIENEVAWTDDPMHARKFSLPADAYCWLESYGLMCHDDIEVVRLGTPTEQEKAVVEANSR